MHNNTEAATRKPAFEPSVLVEYGDADQITQGGGGPAAQPDGAVYNS
jgi:hypothetical protein